METHIALVDDNRRFRSGLISIIGTLKGYDVIFEVSNGEELIGHILQGHKPHIVLLDSNMPVVNGIDTISWLRSSHPEIKIIVLSKSADPPKVLSMFKLGIKGFLMKDAEAYEFEQALKKVLHNDIYYPDFVTRYLLDAVNPVTDQQRLNSREIEFLKLASSELTYKEIADQMRVSVRTVDGYRDQLFEKLHVKSRVGLVLYAIKNKVIDL